MKISFTKDFSKELHSLQDRKLAEAVRDIIKDVEQAKSPWEIHSIRKLKGYKTAFRIRSGNFRIGVFIERGEVLFAAIGRRKDIYKNFP